MPVPPPAWSTPRTSSGAPWGSASTVTVFTAAGGAHSVHGLSHAVSSTLTGSMVFMALGLLVVVAVIARPERLRPAVLRSP